MAHLLVSKAQGVLTLTLNRPEVLNSIGRELGMELIAALRQAASQADVRCVLLAASGRAFCAGQDLGEVRPEPGKPAPDLGQILHNRYNIVIQNIRDLPKPVVCAVQGIAAGAGANLAFAADITIAATEATFVQSFVHVGLMPDSGGTYILPRLIGPQRAALLTMLGEKISATEAERLGLIARVVPAADLPEITQGIASRLAALPQDALAATKHALGKTWTQSLSAQLTLEEHLQAQLGASANYNEGLSAFLEKRKPVFNQTPSSTSVAESKN